MRALSPGVAFGLVALTFCFVAAAAEPTPAAAAPEVRAPANDSGPSTETGRDGRTPLGVALSAGVRTLFVLGGGYEPFAQEGMLWSLSLNGSTTVFADGPMALALGGTWDIARSDSTARGAETGLLVHRFTVTPEVRYELVPRLRAFGRLGIGGSYLHAELEDRVVAAEQSAEAGSFTIDPGLGVALRLGPRKPRRVGVWVTLDGGYLWSTSADLVLRSEDAPARAAPIRLADLSLHGPYTRLSASVEF